MILLCSIRAGFISISYLTGGEPTLHPQFREIVTNAKKWSGCKILAIFTNGCKAMEYADVFSNFDEIWTSHYPNNQREIEFLSKYFMDRRPPQPTIHTTLARRAKNPMPCFRANDLSYYYGRLYPCCCLGHGHEEIGIPLTKNWREEIKKVDMPCWDCPFAEEGNSECNSNSENPQTISVNSETINISHSFQPEATLSSESSQHIDNNTLVRPKEYWPIDPPNIKIYGITTDSWMSKKSEIILNEPQKDMLWFIIESYAPKEIHPITLTFTGEIILGNCYVHSVQHWGKEVIKIPLRSNAKLPGYIQLTSDKTFTPQDQSDLRGFSVRIVSLRYPPQNDQERAACDLEAEPHAIPFYIAAQKKTPTDLLGNIRKIVRKVLPAPIRHLIRKMLAFLRPKLGRLEHYSPRDIKLPSSYYRSLQFKSHLPKISLVTPSLNQGQFLKQTIESVLAQNYPDLEYIIQDGCSFDNTPEILEKFRPLVKHISSQHDTGQSNAINLGFTHATGEIMAWLNSDDILLPNTLNYVVQFFQKHPEVDVVYGHRILINRNDQEIGRWILPPHDKKVLEYVDYVPQETLFWRREIWNKVGGFLDESFHFALDWDLLIRFQQAGANIIRLPRFLGAFRVHPQQKTTQQLVNLGNVEIQRIRLKIHGREISNEEIAENIRSYLWKSIWYDFVYKFGIELK